MDCHNEVRANSAVGNVGPRHRSSLNSESDQGFYPIAGQESVQKFLAMIYN